MKAQGKFTGKGPRREPHQPLGPKGPTFHDLRIGDRVAVLDHKTQCDNGRTGVIDSRRTPARDGWNVRWDNPVFGVEVGRATWKDLVPVGATCAWCGGEVAQPHIYVQGTTVHTFNDESCRTAFLRDAQRDDS